MDLVQMINDKSIEESTQNIGNKMVRGLLALLMPQDEINYL